MSNANYDLIHADEGLQLHWNDQTKTLTVSGEGRCELGDVRGSVHVSSGDVTLQADTVHGSVKTDNCAVAIIGEVKELGRAFADSVLVAENCGMGIKNKGGVAVQADKPWEAEQMLGILQKVAPSVEVARYHDEDHDTAVKQGEKAWISTVTATMIHKGQMFIGEACLGGSVTAAGESVDADISEYLPQMAEEAMGKLVAQTGADKVHPDDQTEGMRDALKGHRFLQAVLGRRYRVEVELEEREQSEDEGVKL
jgi:hypothetical protein